MRLAVSVTLTCLSICVAGCGAGGEFPVASTSGKVVCEGQPVPFAMVFFEPLGSGDSMTVGKQGIGIADDNGNFTVSTYGEKDGAVVGRHRVRVGPPNSDMHPNVSCACSLNSETDVMKVEIKKDEANVFEIALKKKSARDKPSLEQLEALEEAKQAAKENRT